MHSLFNCIHFLHFGLSPEHLVFLFLQLYKKENIGYIIYLCLKYN